MTHEFLLELLRPEKLTKKEIKEKAYWCLRHWPLLTVDVKIRDDEGKWQRLKDISISTEKDE
jgi:hypothetical protein